MQLIYKSSALYQLIIRLLYGRHYAARLRAIADLIPAHSTVVDLCCGPGLLYRRHLKGKSVHYTGLDLSPAFVETVNRAGACGHVQDLRSNEPLPCGDYLIIQGSLYFFLPDPAWLIDRMLVAASRKVIVAEPICNLSTSRLKLVSRFATKLSGPSIGSHPHRFTEETLDQFMKRYSSCVDRSFKIPGGREKVYVLDNAQAPSSAASNQEITRSPSLEETYWWYRARQEIICDTVRRFLACGSEILDFGAGSGLIGKQLAASGYKVVTADISPDAIASCRDHGLNAIDLTRDWPAIGAAQCLLACDVFEHLDNDVKTLQKLRPLLRPPGLLIATVPAYNFLWSGEDYVSGHLRRYTRSLIEERIRDAGFVLVWSTYFNTLLLPLVTAAIFYKRLIRPRDMYVSDVQPLPRWQNTILYRIFAAEQNILPRFRFPAGASILLVARVARF